MLLVRLVTLLMVMWPLWQLGSRWCSSNVPPWPACFAHGA
jgi:hypothetical protein